MKILQKATATIASGLILGATPLVAWGANVPIPAYRGTDQGATAAYGNFTRYSVPRMYNEGYIPRHDGSVLYISAKEIIDSDPDITCGRISNNVSSSGLANGTCDTNPPAAASVLRSAEFRLCRSVNNLPDPCGGWSAKSYR